MVRENKSNVLVSVIIPNYNRPSILHTLESLKVQTFKKFELILVDDHSLLYQVEDKDFAGLANYKIIRLKKNSGAAVARNFGLDAASGKYIAFIDDDCIASDTWLQDMYDHIEHDSSVIAIGGLVMYPPNAVLLQKLIYYMSMNDENSCKVILKGKPIAVDHVSCTNSMWRAEVVKSLKFDETLKRSQDLEICLRAEGEFKTINAGMVYHQYPTSLRHYFRHSFKKGTGGGMLLRRNPHYFGFRRYIMYLFPIYLLGCILFPPLLLAPLLFCRSFIKAYRHSKDAKISILVLVLEYFRYYANMFGIWSELIKQLLKKV
jgi:glycosyltransferase involved in cell wall biosynthesis